MRISWMFFVVTLLAVHHSWGRQNVEIYTPYSFTTLAATPELFTVLPDRDETWLSATGGNMALDSAGNIYLANTLTNTIEMITPSGNVFTIAGNPGVIGSHDGTNDSAGFNLPQGLAVDESGNIYVADTGASTIRRITPNGTNWIVTTLAGRPNATNQTATFFNPQGIAVDNSGRLFVADTLNFTIRMIVPVETPGGTNWVTTTIAGLARTNGYVDGTNSAARFVAPLALALDGAGNIYVADVDLVRKITPVGTNWVVSTPFGQPIGPENQPWYVDGTNSAVRTERISGIALDPAGNIYMTDQFSVVRRATPVGTNWVVTTLGGAIATGYADGMGSSARFNYPIGITVDSIGTVYIADTENHALRVGRPALQYAVTNNQLVFSWPTSPLGGYTLQSSTNLGPGATWLGLTNGVATSGVDFVFPIAIDPNVGATFFRIVPP